MGQVFGRDKKSLPHDLTSSASEMDSRISREGRGSLIVGYAFMAKKMESMERVVGGAMAAIDGVVFKQLDLSRELADQGTFDVILHKLSEDIMYRDEDPVSAARLDRIERYRELNRACAVLDPIAGVEQVINRVSTLKVLQSTYEKYNGPKNGSRGSMPCPPKFIVVEAQGIASQEIWRVIEKAGLRYPLICKPIQACGTLGSHSMLVVMDESGLGAVTVPIVVQEYRNHDARLFKVFVVGDEVRIHERPSLPNLGPGLKGSLAFDSQKPYPTVEDFGGASRSASIDSSRNSENGTETHSAANRANDAGSNGCACIDGSVCMCGVCMQCSCNKNNGHACNGEHEHNKDECNTSECIEVEQGLVRLTAQRLREAFGLSLFGFDLIVARDSREVIIIDVNYFPSFRDLTDFPQVLRSHIKTIAAASSQSQQTSISISSTGDPPPPIE